jgi:pyrroline-5-carboxylate reductase
MSQSSPTASGTQTASAPRIVFVGAGNMAGALMGGLIARGAPPASLSAIDPSAEQRAAVHARLGVHTFAAPDASNLDADVIVLAVKPQHMKDAIGAMDGLIGTPLLISVAAGVRAADLSRWLGGYRRIVRTMPNTPALLGLGATGLAQLPGGDAGDRLLAESILSAVGQVVWVDDESQLDAVTALSGSGPAYVFRMIEAMTEGGMALGLSADQSRMLALQTMLGAATLAAQSNEPASVLRERVTSKGGTTAAALAVMEARNLSGLVTDAMAAAQKRSQELGDEFGR